MIEYKFTTDYIIELHADIIEESGGVLGILNPEALDGAVNSIYASYDGIELYPTLEEKAAALCYNLINDHCFRDGNKRVGVIAMSQFLQVYNKHIEHSNQDLIKLGFNVAEGKMNREDILVWIKEREISLDISEDKQIV